MSATMQRNFIKLVEQDLEERQGAVDTINANRKPDNETQTGNLRFYQGGVSAAKRILDIARSYAASAPAGDAVAWQRRLRRVVGDSSWSDWAPCSPEQAEYVKRNGYPQDYGMLEAEVRPLYARPPAPALEVREAWEIAAVHKDVLRAIAAWRANPQTTYTPTCILNDFGDEIVAALSASPREMVRHHYSPSTLHMGDCSICGNVYDAPLHIGSPSEHVASHSVGRTPGPSEPSPSSRSETAGECPRWPRAGDKMTFLGKNGYDYELQAAMKIFEVGAEYTVRGCDVGDWRHTISFEGKPGHFNGVMFARIAPDCSGCKTPDASAVVDAAA